MGLPVKLSGVHYYRVAGRYIFAGDLFIARSTIYFFPAVDLQEQRDNATKHLPHEIGLIVLVVMYLLQNLSSSSSRDLWEEGMSEGQFQKKADAHIAKLKEQRKSKGFAESLPLPLRVSANELSNMRLSLSGKLSFFAQSDNHDFNIGLRRRNRLRDALWEAGLLKL